MIFWNLGLRKYFLFFFNEFELLLFHKQYCVNFRKIEQADLVENLPPSYLPYRFLHNLCSFLLLEKVKIFDFLKTILMHSRM